mgnify:FL=1
MPTETSQTLDRGICVLEVLSRSQDGMTVTQIAHDLGISRTVVYRLLATLEQHALVLRGADGKTRAGMALLSMARTVQFRLREVSMPILRTLADTSGCIAHLWLAEDEDIVTVATLAPQSSSLAVAAAARDQRVGTRRHRLDDAASEALADVLAPTGVQVPKWRMTTDPYHPSELLLCSSIRAVAGLHAAIGIAILRGEDHRVLSPSRQSDLGEMVHAAAVDIGRGLR